MAALEPLFTREAIQTLEEELDRNGSDILMPPCRDGTRARQRNECRGPVNQDPAPGEVLKSNNIRFRGEREFEKLSGENREGEYRCVHLTTVTREGPVLSQAESTAYLAACFASYYQTPEFAWVRAALTARHNQLRDVDKIVCFGLGRLDQTVGEDEVVVEMDSDDESLAYPSNPMRQHAAAVAVAEHLEALRGDGHQVRVYAQDPLYTSTDKHVVPGAGISIVSGFGGRALLLVDENTIVMARQPAFPIREVVADLARPAAMFWTSMDVGGFRDPRSVRTDLMREDYDEQVIEDARVFTHTTLYMYKAPPQAADDTLTPGPADETANGPEPMTPSDGVSDDAEPDDWDNLASENELREIDPDENEFDFLLDNYLPDDAEIDAWNMVHKNELN
ncbi:hypothetical protein JX265_009451 [Neoarthrinium moseri]|uniref:SRR1-like domain-containing protein n=1 Tax=Neoarthrinium moseri TaxID=1658444 RepID=A0A9P9WFV6_9PEZI|nr:hypothetical protein JX266_008882 [Neoarthrinium moseri]KAI1861484.1 hypothetical protein JX265_009451 [Neoarthrinium moseri]